jgi:hypothetical protein
MATGVFYQSWKEYLAEGANCGSDTFKVILSNSAPNVSTHTVLADATDLSTTGGYTAGGNTAAVSSSAQSAGTYKLVLSDPTAWTGSGGGFGPFRYAILYDDTLASDPLVMYWDYGSSISVAASETFTVDLSASNGVFTVA